MTNLFFTLLIAFLVVTAAMALLGIGWLITGKSGIIRGACGMDPKKLRDKKCGSADIRCDLCGSENTDKKEEE